MSRFVDNQKYWDDMNERYPYQCRTDKGVARPDQVEVHGQFLAVPLDGKVLWGFESQQALDLFMQQYGGEKLP